MSIKARLNILIKKTYTIFPHLSVLLGVLTGSTVSYIMLSNVDLIETALLPPSFYSDKYITLIGEEYLTDKKTSFTVDADKEVNVSLESPFVKSLQDFCVSYIDTLSSDNPELNLSEFYLKKDKDTFDLIEEDLYNNEPLYMMKKSDLTVVSKDNGSLSSDGSTATISIVFEFVVDEILVKNDATNYFSVGKKYSQERVLTLKKCTDGSYKIYEIYIKSPVEK